MIYTKLTIKAMNIAYNAHNGQLDKSNTPYIFHPIHLAEQMDDEISTCVALLHDVVEDTKITFEDLKKEFPKEVIDALKLLTHDKETDYFDYVRKIKTNKIATKVKLADLAHNSDFSRFVNTDITDDKLDYYKNKYSNALKILTEN